MGYPEGMDRIPSGGKQAGLSNIRQALKVAGQSLGQGKKIGQELGHGIYMSNKGGLKFLWSTGGQIKAMSKKLLSKFTGENVGSEKRLNRTANFLNSEFQKALGDNSVDITKEIKHVITDKTATGMPEVFQKISKGKQLSGSDLVKIMSAVESKHGEALEGFKDSRESVKSGLSKEIEEMSSRGKSAGNPNGTSIFDSKEINKAIEKYIENNPGVLDKHGEFKELEENSKFTHGLDFKPGTNFSLVFGDDVKKIFNGLVADKVIELKPDSFTDTKINERTQKEIGDLKSYQSDLLKMQDIIKNGGVDEHGYKAEENFEYFMGEVDKKKGELDQLKHKGSDTKGAKADLEIATEWRDFFSNVVNGGRDLENMKGEIGKKLDGIEKQIEELETKDMKTKLVDALSNSKVMSVRDRSQIYEAILELKETGKLGAQSGGILNNFINKAK